MKRHPDLVALGNRLRALRAARGWSQEGFAHHCGLDRTYYGGIERGERNVAVINLLRIGRALKVEPSELLGDPNPPSP